MAISSFYTPSPIDVAKTLACIGVDYASFCYSTLTDSLYRVGKAGRSLANRCTNIVHRCTSKPKQKVPHLSYPAFYLNKGVKSNVAMLTELFKFTFPGIIHYDRDGLECTRCMDHAGFQVGTTITLYTVHDREIKGYRATATPQKGDLIFYFEPFKHSFEENQQSFEHVGVVSQVENGVVWVESKWGDYPVYQHLEEAVPHVYGTAVVYLHKSPTWI